MLGGAVHRINAALALLTGPHGGTVETRSTGQVTATRSIVIAVAIVATIVTDATGQMRIIAAGIAAANVGAYSVGFAAHTGRTVCHVILTHRKHFAGAVLRASLAYGTIKRGEALRQKLAEAV